jgi:Serine aminopeptidase, S33
LSSDAWDAQTLFLVQRGYHVVAHDRRGHGRSGQSWQGNNMDQYADDFAELINHLDLEDATRSAVPLEVARSSVISRHGQKRVVEAGVPPLMLKTKRNPGGLPLLPFDDICALAADRQPITRMGTSRNLLPGSFCKRSKKGRRSISRMIVSAKWPGSPLNITRKEDLTSRPGTLCTRNSDAVPCNSRAAFSASKFVR